MHFKRKSNDILLILFWGVTAFISGMATQSLLNLPKYTILFIGTAVYLFAYGVYKLLIRLNPLRMIEKKIRKLPNKHQQLKMFFDEYIPEMRKTYPQKIYKYIYLNDISSTEKCVFHKCSNQLELERHILDSSSRTSNERKLYSLVINSLWFTRSSSDTLNDPFEGRRIVYKDDFTYFNEWQIEYWKQYSENIRNNIFLCCFSKNNDSPPMWANYANNYKGYCLEFEILDTHNLWEVDYGYGKNALIFELEGLLKDLTEKRITKEEVDQYIKQLHIYWASSKHGDWEYEKEIRAMFTNLNEEKNISYETMGIKLSAIIIGHNCAEEHRQFLVHIADKLSIPIKITALNTTSIKYLDILDYEK